MQKRISRDSAEIDMGNCFDTSRIRVQVDHTMETSRT